MHLFSNRSIVATDIPFNPITPYNITKDSIMSCLQLPRAEEAGTNLAPYSLFAHLCSLEASCLMQFKSSLGLLWILAKADRQHLSPVAPVPSIPLIALSLDARRGWHRVSCKPSKTSSPSALEQFCSGEKYA